MKKWMTVVAALLVATMPWMAEKASAERAQVDGIFRILTIKNDGKRMATGMAGVQYHNKPTPKSIWECLSTNIVFNFVEEGAPAKPGNGATRTLKGNISIHLGIPDGDACDPVVLKGLTLTSAGDDTDAGKSTATKWSLSSQELARIREVSHRAQAQR